MHGGKYDVGSLIMICINFDNAEFLSYRIQLNATPPIDFSKPPKNNITIPDSSVFDFQYDTKMRVIIALVGIMNNFTREVIHDSMEVHYFHIEGCLGWKSKHSMRDYNLLHSFEPNRSFFGYSSTFQKGMFVWNSEPYLPEVPIDGVPYLINVTLVVFDVDFISYNLMGVREYHLISTKGRIKRVQYTNENLFLALLE